MQPFTPPQLELEATAYTAPQLKEAVAARPLAQVALAGRSNVGKSTALNRLAGRKQLAKTSSTPGKTRSINFYRVLGHPLYLVDLPGYGYAKCSKTEREAWAKLIDGYLRETERLAALVMLIDSRHQPQDLDVDLAGYARDLGIRVLPLLTKVDKVKLKDVGRRTREWKGLLAGHQLCDPIPFSGVTGQGVEALWKELLALGAEAD